ncbi:MAG: hypothetical protein HY717_13220 [Planctomycetes bacterium]|nr:hypothetical protein [Planctomycetota bacterium]
MHPPGLRHPEDRPRGGSDPAGGDLFPSIGGFGALWVVGGDFNGDRIDEALALYSIPVDRPYGEEGGEWPGSLPKRLEALKRSEWWTRSFYRAQAGPLAVYFRDPAKPFPTRGDFVDAWTNTRPWMSPAWTLETWILEPAVVGSVGYSNAANLITSDERAVVALGSRSVLLLGRNAGAEAPGGQGSWNSADVGLQTDISSCALGDLTGDGKAEVAALGDKGAILVRSALGGRSPEAVFPVETLRSDSGPPLDPFDRLTPTPAKTVFGHPSGRLTIGGPSRDGKNELLLAVRAGDRGILVSYQRRAYGPTVSTDGKGAWDFEVVDILRPGEAFMDALIDDYNADGAAEIIASTNRGRIFAYRRAEVGYRPDNKVPLHDYTRRMLYQEKDLVINSLAGGNTDGDDTNGHEIAFSVSPGSPQIPVPWGHYLLYNTAP